MTKFQNYNTFSESIIDLLNNNGFIIEYENNMKKTKRIRYGDTNIILVYPGFNSYRDYRADKRTYDCEIRLLDSTNGTDSSISFSDICEDILAKINNDITAQLHINNVLKYTAQFPLPYMAIDMPNEYTYFNNLGLGYSIQDFVDMISFIALIEEFNFPLLDASSNKYRGRSDCFGRYIETLWGGRTEYNNIKNKLSTSSIFSPNPKYASHYLTHIINRDRLVLSNFPKK